MVNSRFVNISVGCFVCAGFLGLLLLSLRVSGISFSNSDTYEIKALFSNVSGLTNRADVSIAGVSIGKVTSIYLQDDNLAQVSMAINEEIHLPVDTSAVILTSGLLGSKYVGLVVGGDDEMMEKGDTIFDTQSSLQLEDLVTKFLVK